MTQSRRVFISSVSGGRMKAYREAAGDACHRLALHPVNMEEFGPETPPPLNVCLRGVREADLFLCIVAHRYGSTPPGSDMAFTEHEYECALSLGLPIHVYIVDPNHPWPPTEIDAPPSLHRLEAFKSRLKENHTVRFFGEVADFREDLLLYLNQLKSSWTEDSRLKAPQTAGAVRTIPHPPHPHHVPPYTLGHPFTGREAELAALDEWGYSADPMMVIDAIGGNGKSALTWQWAETHAEMVMPELAGRLWWSFYENASMDAFLIDATAYTAQRGADEIHDLPRKDRMQELLSALRERPFLIVLDGVERLLLAYHQFDPSKLRDDKVDESARALTEDHDALLLQQLSMCTPSKVLLSTRLFPLALENSAHQVIPGVRHRSLGGFTSADSRRLLSELGVTGNETSLRVFFDRLGNHPLLVGVVAGLVRDYRKAPGNFDRWVADPAAGGSLRLSELNLVQRRTHILNVALDGLHPLTRRLLGYLSVPSGGVDFDFLQAVNPFDPESLANSGSFDDLFDWFEPDQDLDSEPSSAAASLPASPELVPINQEFGGDAEQLDKPLPDPTAELDRALIDLEDRGLLWWDRSSNTYNLHPIVRAYAYDRLEGGERVDANEKVHDYFAALPPENVEQAASVNDLKQTLTVFQTLVGAERLREAVELYQDRLANVLYMTLKAYSTIVELLEPLAKQDRLRDVDKQLVHNELGIALSAVGRLGEAIEESAKTLALAIDLDEARFVMMDLGNLAAHYRNANRFIESERAIDLARECAKATTSDPFETVTYLWGAATYGRTGRFDEARSALDTFSSRARPPESLTSLGAPEALACELRFLDRTLDERFLSAAIEQGQSPHIRIRFARLRRNLAIRQGDWETARTLAEGVVGMAREESRPTFLDEAVLAQVSWHLGRRHEALALVESTLALAEAAHPALRPYLPAADVLMKGRQQERAATLALRAYEIVWAQGPPYADQANLDWARQLLSELGVDEPSLPVERLPGQKFPLEARVVDFISRVRSRYESP